MVLTKGKMLFLILVALMLLITVTATFVYKDSRYGIDNLPNIVSRVVRQHSAELYYRVSFAARDKTGSLPEYFGLSDRVIDEERDARAVPVLVYHGIADKGGDYTISQATFAEHMFTLHQAGWKTISSAALEQFLRGTATVPERSFLLTFDDGAKSSFYPVDPVLSALGVHALTFILPKYSLNNGTHYYLSLGELNSMLANGRWEIGSHSQEGHQLFPADAAGAMTPALGRPLWLLNEERLETQQEYEKRIEADLRISRHNLEQALGIPITSFAFPFGEFGQLNDSFPAAITTVARIAGDTYKMSFYQVRRGEGFTFNYPTPEQTGMLLVRRIEPHPETTAHELLEHLENGLPKDIPFVEDFSAEQGWFSVWGPYSFTLGQLSLAASPEETGNAVILDGTRDWRDYTVRMRVHSPSRTGIYLWVRFQGSEQHAGCNFGNGFIHVEETILGDARVIQGLRTDDIIIPDGDFTIEARVQGRSLTCTLDERASATSEFLNPALDTGGIGVKIWSPESGRARLIIKNIHVDSAP